MPRKRDLTRSPWMRRYMFPSLPWSPWQPEAERLATPEEVRWTLRGEPRTRRAFAMPHPADFPGGLPDPPEYPR